MASSVVPWMPTDVSRSIAASIMLASARAVRSAWVRDWSVLFWVGEGCDIRKHKLVGNKQVYQVTASCQFHCEIPNVLRQAGCTRLLNSPGLVVGSIFVDLSRKKAGPKRGPALASYILIIG
jgi:hypothetical protein